ncbi:ParB N-terminal domain-containing protein [Streptomyces sp. NBC_00237]|uniref:ParB/RepB/Spo0J family partition protein n=1 Tax=Streptomyces sp. NBC_00237 TaxID=2975687 RepID=UPI0022564CB3|nr:ParB N-terminal domain-containing protein [Streptomyces sp. NBC_00237]MCX5206684.1 ParB N-terminal domain-containing protein [Streptomyces sp. NBC_00237]
MTSTAPALDTTVSVPGFTGHFTWVDPYDLVVDPYNHRRHREEGKEDGTEPDPDLIASVEEVGVQSLLLLRPQTGDNEGRLGIVFGQRRNKAAIIAADKAKTEGRPYRLVPALIREDLTGVDDQALALSVLENKHREDAHARDYIDAARQLALMDLPPAVRDKHARTIGISPAEMAAADKASQLTDARLAAGVNADFDLLELADFQEVETVAEAHRKLSLAKRRDLAENSTGGNWAHTMAEMREKKAEAARRVKLLAELTASGITLLEWKWSWRDTPARPLEDLFSQLGTPLTAELHARCPGHAAALHPRDADVTWLCADFKKHQHELPGADSATDAKTKELAKEARRKVIRYNKAWRSAREVRQEFITSLCDQPGDAPNDMWVLILKVITGTSHEYSRYLTRHRTDLMATFLKIEDPNHDRTQWNRVGQPFKDLINRTGKVRRWRLLFAQVAAMYEHEQMSDRHWDTPSSQTADWLDFLKTHGYALSEIEAEILSTRREKEENARKGAAKGTTKKTADADAA